MIPDILNRTKKNYEESDKENHQLGKGSLDLVVNIDFDSWWYRLVAMVKIKSSG